MVGVAFRFGAVPFHMWIPDVYHGAPTLGDAVPRVSAQDRLHSPSRSGCLPKGLAATGLGLVGHAHDPFAVLSMALGNVVAIAQTNLEAHAGVLDDLARRLHPARHPCRRQQRATRRRYVLHAVYVIMALGSFGMILLLESSGLRGGPSSMTSEGLDQRSPWFAAVMLMLMFSTAGVPPFIGFFAKFCVILAVLDQGMAWLAAVAVLLLRDRRLLLHPHREADVFRRSAGHEPDRGRSFDALHAESQRARSAGARRGSGLALQSRRPDLRCSAHPVVQALR